MFEWMVPHLCMKWAQWILRQKKRHEVGRWDVLEVGLEEAGGDSGECM